MSVRLRGPLESQLAAYCATAGMSKSAAVQAALEKHLKKQTQGVAGPGGTKRAAKDPFLALIGSGNREYSTEQAMRMTRNDDWNRP